MSRKILFILLSYLSFVHSTTASDSLSISPIYPSTFATYDIEQGLLISCIEETFTDPKGRMWVNPCRIMDIHQKQSFFQFDGNKSYPITFPDPGGDPLSSSWFIRDLTSNGDLVGANLSRTHTFFYNPDTQEKHFFSFEAKEQVVNLLVQENNEVIVITQSPAQYAVYRLSKAKKERLNAIELDLPDEFIIHFNTPAIQTQGVIIFLHQKEGFIQFDLATHAIKAYLWKDLFKQDDIIFGNAFLTSLEDGKATFFVGTPDSFFEYDILSEELNPDLKLNRLLNSLPKADYPGVEIDFFKDKSGNSLVGISWWPLEGIYAQQSLYLIDTNGHYFNYQSIINEVNKTNRYRTVFTDDRPLRAKFINSNNFKKEAIVSTEGGINAVEIKTDLALDIYLEGWASRAIIEWQPNKIAVASDNGYFQLVDLVKKEDSLIGQSLGTLVCGENINLPPFSQIIHQDHDKIWFSGGQELVSYQQNSCTTFPVNQIFDKFNFLSEQEVILATIYEYDVFIYNLAQKQLRPFITNEGLAFNTGGKVNQIMMTKDGYIWMATLNGLWKINPKTKEVIQLNEKNGLANNQVICIHEAKDGKIWLGMINGGLQIYDPTTGVFKSFNESNGLSNKSAVGILEDEDGDKWVSTFSGITVLSEQEEILFKIYEEDGLSHKEFNRFSYYKMKDGRFIFGTVSGINMIDPKEIKSAFTQKDELFLYLTEISYFDNQQNKDTTLRSQFNHIPTITLPATHRYLSLDFSLSDYIHAQKSSFAYRLAGTKGIYKEQEDDWVNLGSNSFLTLNDLPAGKHTLLVRGTDYKGQLIEEIISIPIKVKEFFYKTWWFYALCTLPFIVGIILWNRRLVTEKNRLEEEVEKRTHQIQKDKKLIEQQATKLQELDEIKSRFFTNISHEFRTPLTVISGMADQVEGQENVKELIKRNSASLLNMVNQILDIRKLEAGKLELNLIQEDIIKYIKYIIESFSSLAKNKGVDLQFQSSQEDIIMDYDPEKLLRIISNLLSNAIKFTPEGGQIEVHAFKNKAEQFTLSVKDNGVGIPNKQLPYIFDRFYQVSNQDKPLEASSGGGGTGIGLALTKELIKLMNGEISVKSNAEQLSSERGTTFTIYLPISRKAKISSDDAFLNQSLQTPVVDADKLLTNLIGQQDSSLPKLLIVEDNPDIVHYLVTCLKDQFQLDIAKDGQEGIERAFEESPDIILSDVMMPRKNGYELCQTIKLDQRTSHIPIVLLTAKADIESRIEGLERGADAYLAKPFNKKELLVSLQKLIEIRRRLQDRYSTQGVLEPSDDPNIQLEDAFIVSVREAVEQHIDQPNFGPNELAKTLGMSRSSFFAKIKALTDRSPALFIRSIRLHHSKPLLKNTDLNISQVAYEVGFDDPNYFSRCFSQEFGISPKQFRG